VTALTIMTVLSFLGGGAERRLRRPLEALLRPDAALREPDVRLPALRLLPEVLPVERLAEVFPERLADREPEVEDDARLDLLLPARRRVDPPALERLDFDDFFFLGDSQANSSSSSSSSSSRDRRARAVERLAILGS